MNGQASAELGLAGKERGGNALHRAKNGLQRVAEIAHAEAQAAAALYALAHGDHRAGLNLN